MRKQKKEEWKKDCTFENLYDSSKEGNGNWKVISSHFLMGAKHTTQIMRNGPLCVCVCEGWRCIEHNDVDY